MTHYIWRPSPQLPPFTFASYHPIKCYPRWLRRRLTHSNLMNIIFVFIFFIIDSIISVDLIACIVPGALLVLYTSIPIIIIVAGLKVFDICNYNFILFLFTHGSGLWGMGGWIRENDDTHWLFSKIKRRTRSLKSFIIDVGIHFCF